MIGAGQVLAQMPVTAQLFVRGQLSWGQVRRVTRAARTLRVAQRGVLDEQVAASAREHGGIDAFGPDQLCDAVDAAAGQPHGCGTAADEPADTVHDTAAGSSTDSDAAGADVDAACTPACG